MKQQVDAADIWAQPEHGSYPAMRCAPDPPTWRGPRSAGRRAFARHHLRGGVVIAGASAALQDLAEMLKAAVCLTVSGQGSLADTHPLNAGVVGSNGGVMATRDVVAAADAVLFVGCRAGSTSTEHWRFPSRDVPILHIDVDPSVIGANYRTEVGMVGDARLALEALAVEVRERLAHRPADAVDGSVLAGRAKQARREQLETLAASLDAPIRPERVVQSLNRLLPDDAVVCADPGTPCPYFSAYYDVSRPGRHFITNRAHGALGFSMSAAMGAWVGRPQSSASRSWATAALASRSVNWKPSCDTRRRC